MEHGFNWYQIIPGLNLLPSWVAGSILVSMCTYGYFLKSAAFSVAQLEENRVEVQMLSGEVAGLETEYLNRIQSLGMDEAHALGLSNTKTISFVERGSNTKLTFAETGRKGESR